MDEQWKDIEGYEGLYQISNTGRVKSLARIFYNKDGKPHKANCSDFILKDRYSAKGYKCAVLRKNLVPKSFQIHRLVAFAFIGKPNFDRDQINHINMIKDDNRVENLEWVNNRENVLHRLKDANRMYPTGVKKKGNRFISAIIVNKKSIYLGSFSDPILAYEARVKFETENLITNKYL